MIVSACGSPASSPPATTGATGAGTAGGGTTGGDQPGSECVDPQPFAGAFASWSEAPFEPPAPGAPSDDDDDDGGDDQTFLIAPDGANGGIYECDLWAQDCPEGEKCMPWASDGGEWNATRCSEVADDAGMHGDMCTAEGNGYSGVDDCELGAMCWDVDRMNAGSCIGLCDGSADDPICPDGTWCYVGYQGSVTVCLDESLCAADGACRCMCPDGEDPDCTPEQCEPEREPEPEPEPRPEPEPEPPTRSPPEIEEGEPGQCPDTYEPVVMHMSNDDSNSQASPILARRWIREGGIVPLDAIRVHEFMNYYQFLGAPPQDDNAARVSMQMRNTGTSTGEFALVLNAQAKGETTASRPPMNVVFSLDTSGSMEGPPIELLKDTLAAAAGSFRAGDVVSVVTWANEQTVIVDGLVVAGPDDPTLMGAIEQVVAGGGTDLQAGLVHAYDLANAHRIDEGINRVVLISDGGANAGVTDVDLIASEAQAEDGQGIYLVGVGVGTSTSYRDDLMDEVTDAGKGAYVYIDETAEADKQFGDRFLANMAVAARNVRMQLTLPWYFGIKAFHGETFAGSPTEVEPQHLAPNDSMTFHQIVSACDPSLITTCDEITARVDYLDPLTGDAKSDEFTASVEHLVSQPATMLHKADIVVGYAKSLIAIAQLANHGEFGQALTVATDMQTWVADAAEQLQDPELAEIAALLQAYVDVLAPLAP